MYEEHEVFKKPDNENEPIWRYMDFTKFVDLLDRSALFFSRSDKLGDPFEGSYSKPSSLRSIRASAESLSEPTRSIMLKIIDDPAFGRFRRELPKMIAVNCWHMSAAESAAMWKLYLKSNEGIAIVSTFKRLKDSLKDEQKVYIGKVEYLNYEQSRMASGNILQPFVHKRQSFEYERELRALTWQMGSTESGLPAPFTPPFDDGTYVQLDLDTLIEEVYFAPTGPPWLSRLVESVMATYDLRKPVHRSALDAEALF